MIKLEKKPTTHLQNGIYHSSIDIPLVRLTARKGIKFNRVSYRLKSKKSIGLFRLFNRPGATAASA